MAFGGCRVCCHLDKYVVNEKFGGQKIDNEGFRG